MTIDEVRQRVESIKNDDGDDEAQHAAEDDLHVSVLRAIADGAENAAELAAEALKTCDIDFCRWCA